MLPKGRVATIRLIHLFLVLILIAGCDPTMPEKNRIENDSIQYIKKAINDEVIIRIVSIGPGEGDSDNVYQHVVFEIEAQDETILTTGLFQGKRLNKGQILKNGEMVILYQKEGKNNKEWMPAKYEMRTIPG